LIYPESLYPAKVWVCEDCGDSNDPYWHYDPWCFVKLDGLQEDVQKIANQPLEEPRAA
jgi:hypothetical protein